MKIFEILEELPNVTQTLSEKMLLEKWHQQTYSMQDYHKLSTYQNMISAENNKIRYD